MKRKSFASVAVINANAVAIGNVLTLTKGKFNVDGDVSNNATNLGWGLAIPWQNVKAYRRSAYSAGAFHKFKINLTGVSPAASTLYGFKVKQLDGFGVLKQDELFEKEVKVWSAASGETDLSLALKFYNAFLKASAGTDIVVSNVPVSGSEYFYIECKFGTAGEEIFDALCEETETAIATITDQTAFAQPKGTPAIVDKYAPDGYAGASSQYVTYEVDYYVDAKSSPDGHYDHKLVTGVAFVVSTVDTAWKTEFLTIFNGFKTNEKTITGFTKAADAVLTVTAHGLTAGDVIFLKDIKPAAVDTDWDALNNLAIAVKAVSDANTFTIETDTSGYTSTFSSGSILINDPYKAV